MNLNRLILLLIVLLGIAALIGIGYGVLVFFRFYQRRAFQSLEAIYADLDIEAQPRPGDVFLSYHTYHGLIAWVTQTPHCVVLPPREARKLLNRLLGFTLTWGWLTPGVVFVLPLAFLNFFIQRRSIASQEAKGGYSDIENEPSCRSHKLRKHC